MNNLKIIRKGFAVAFTYLVLSVLPGCVDIRPEGITDDPVELDEVISSLNNIVDGLVQLVQIVNKETTVELFTLQHKDGKESYMFGMEDGRVLSLFSSISSSHYKIPEISIGEDSGDYYWILNGDWIKSQDLQKVRVLGWESKPVFFKTGNNIYYSLGSETRTVLVEGSNSNNVIVAKIDYDQRRNCLLLKLSDTVTFELSLRDQTSLLKQDVQNEVYYKDVFLDAGAGLTSRKTLYAAQTLGLSLEGISFSRNAEIPEEVELQHSIIAGSEEDENGRLLYPDGQPRYKLLFVNGGSSTTHGKSLGEEGLLRMREFVANGGSYVGTCAGAFFASSGYDSHEDYPAYLHLWPGILNHTGITNGSTDMTIEDNSPLLDYYSFGGDGIVINVRHNKGGYPVSLPNGTEVLARYYCPDVKTVHKQPSIWSYKANLLSGRVIMEGSHPEEVGQGERLDLTSAMMLYAMDGRGLVSVKGFLKNGEKRVMDRMSSDNQPEFARIGDMQCHHFAVYIPRDAKNIMFEVEGSDNSNMILRLDHKSYAFPKTAEFVSEKTGNKQCLFFPSFYEGVTYVSVQCTTSVVVEETEYGQYYSEQTEVLNGFPYYVKVSWEE
ncbi:MAG: hypothetical protein IKX60_06900 [Bacteroidales bacterium]|nr:hypothetical protein [Bacteroidales bacterium]